MIQFRFEFFEKKGVNSTKKEIWRDVTCPEIFMESTFMLECLRVLHRFEIQHYTSRKYNILL